ncbi:EamA family transporter [Campylobacter concisus]|uniref:EamA family transporter n=1 Tax=Campylobacter concisus TaxID=199 RepID=A0A1Y5MQV0_9BACT|nr:DMT family transporter [Campylobacter concisus]OUT10970.1 EamA family transporter [Campylobacter concisus]
MRNLSAQNRADIALIVVAIVWGATFLPMANALKTNGVFVMLFCRFFLSAIFMGFVALKFTKKFDTKSVIYGIILGAVLFLSFATQTYALKLTFSSSVAFITGLECVIVPFMTALIFKNKITIFAIFGAFIAIFGLWLLSGATLALESGEALALLCAIFYALYTSLNGHFVRKCELYLLVFMVFLTVSLLSFVFAFIEGGVVPNYDREFFIAIFITAFIGTIFCYFVQTIAQKYTTASKAALFFCLEPVSAGLIGYFIAGEILSIWQIFGAVLIIFGVIFSEFGKQICSKFKL